jgi:glycosyltransferase involved in cell wall biosynthesis
MRLLFLSNLYPPYDLGGFEQWCQEIATLLQRRGHEVCVLTSRFGVNAQAPIEQNVIRHLHLQSDIHFYHPADFFFKRRAQDRDDAVELNHAIDQFKPDVLVVWGMWNLSRYLPYQAEQLMPGRVVYYIASYWPTDTDTHVEYWKLRTNRRISAILKSPLRAIALKQLEREGYPPLLRFEHVMCCTQYVRDTLVTAGALPDSASVVCGGIDPEPFLQNSITAGTTPARPLRLVYFGSLLPHKGVHTAIEAVSILKERGLSDQTELTIIGTGDPQYEIRLHTLVSEHGLNEQVHFVGKVPRNEIPARLAQFDVFLFTSIWAEPFGRTIVEAMAAGLIVIGSDVGGSREIFQHYDDVMLFQPEDACSVADKIALLIANPERQTHLRQRGRQIVSEQFTLERMAGEIEAQLAQRLTNRA